MRLIDADALLRDIEKYHLSDGKFQHWVEVQNTIDAVPIIRCRDCKWYGRADKRRFYRGMDCLNNRIASIVPDEDYCSRAERREDD